VILLKARAKILQDFLLEACFNKVSFKNFIKNSIMFSLNLINRGVAGRKLPTCEAKLPVCEAELPVCEASS